jgi:hypothetical protein
MIMTKPFNNALTAVNIIIMILEINLYAQLTIARPITPIAFTLLFIRNHVNTPFYVVIQGIIVINHAVLP